MAGMLAKDHWGDDYDGPHWVQMNLWMIATYGGRTTRECANRLIYGMPTRPHLPSSAPASNEQLWQKLEKIGPIDGIAYSLPHRCAESIERWVATPKLAPKDYKDTREELSRAASRLAKELEMFVARIRPGAMEEHTPGMPFNFTQFMTEDEQKRLERAASMYCEQDRSAIWEDLVGQEAVVPDIPTLLRRVGEFFLDDSMHPPIDRPNNKNAQRNQFIDDLLSYFLVGMHDAPPSVIADIVALHFPQGCTSDDISQRKARHPASADPA